MVSRVTRWSGYPEGLDITGYPGSPKSSGDHATLRGYHWRKRSPGVPHNRYPPGYPGACGKRLHDTHKSLFSGSVRHHQLTTLVQLHFLESFFALSLYSASQTSFATMSNGDLDSYQG